jgi:hypothetical protein
MSSRATRPPKEFKPKPPIIGRDFPDLDEYGRRKAICKICHCVLFDCEPASGSGEFNHPGYTRSYRPKETSKRRVGAKLLPKRVISLVQKDDSSCPNAGRVFNTQSPEIEPWMSKSRRRYLKRNGFVA